MTPTFKINIFQTEFGQLCQAIDEAIARTRDQVILTGMEPICTMLQNQIIGHLDRIVSGLVISARKPKNDTRRLLVQRSERSVGWMLGRARPEPASYWVTIFRICPDMSWSACQTHMRFPQRSLYCSRSIVKVLLNETLLLMCSRTLQTNGVARPR